MASDTPILRRLRRWWGDRNQGNYPPDLAALLAEIMPTNCETLDEPIERACDLAWASMVETLMHNDPSNGSSTGDDR